MTRHLETALDAVATDAGPVLHVAGIFALVLALGLLLRRALPVSVERGWYECGPVALVIWDYGACLCWKRVIRFSWGRGKSITDRDFNDD